MKARIASKLAKLDSVNPAVLYAVKNAALQGLFSVPGFNPLVRDAWSTPRGVLLSLKLNRTNSWLHLPFHQRCRNPSEDGWIAGTASQYRGRNLDDFHETKHGINLPFQLAAVVERDRTRALAASLTNLKKANIARWFFGST